MPREYLFLWGLVHERIPLMSFFGRSGQEIEMRTMTGAGRRASAAGRIAVLCVVLTGAGFGCSGGRGSPFVAQEDARINIEVINHGFQDVTLHALWSGQRRRLGTVSGTRTANFMLPWDRSCPRTVNSLGLETQATRTCSFSYLDGRRLAEG